MNRFQRHMDGSDPVDPVDPVQKSGRSKTSGPVVVGRRRIEPRFTAVAAPSFGRGYNASMTPKLSDEQRAAIKQHPGTPVFVVDMDARVLEEAVTRHVVFVAMAVEHGVDRNGHPAASHDIDRRVDHDRFARTPYEQ